MNFSTFFQQYGLIILLVILLLFMFWSSRRRMAKQKLEQEAKARQTVPGAEVLMQGGLYGTIVAYDPDNLDQPALVEIAPGVQIKVHSQAILRVVANENVTEDEFIEAEVDQAEYQADVASGWERSVSDDAQRAAERAEKAPHIETAEETAKRLQDETDGKKDKPEA
ncbi:preprotein translocase subunit YajC [Microbacterium sp.]|uniref:preprotein translocase subunit YajC n=1 Tax=Microbacterium sp. TaxID=51671 RepID=UPI00092C30A0|nr:preprotein translocase subunit YajC [Microbacterium sp.]OJU62124.1 MAG: preprotein translocase subunit YajC [Microbacterium sp. 70-38]MBN9169792.1 preprotein translocase subunit YajC [Microbacterium sp.]MBN9179233.1 preprotein translocase subunit YajC [Microbacterium sp.]MBN9188518.1 preprotein translocase subunit YajC [Microbacterium sp.]MBN9191283.1 preprotein translocase subunit YajC [Microbacterium sp.]